MSLKIFNKDFREGLTGHYDMLFADPPDNIGLRYEGFEDKMSDRDYRHLLCDTLFAANKCDIFWMSFNCNHLALVGSLLTQGILEDGRKHRFLMQYVSFGNAVRNDFSRCYRPILRVMHPDAKTYPDEVRIESERQRIGDKRADPRGKLPPDVWAIHRVVGNSGQKRSWHKTQLNEALYERCLKFSAKPGDRVADLYAGTGTMARAARGMDLDVELFDVSEFYCQKIAEEFGVEVL